MNCALTVTFALAMTTGLVAQDPVIVEKAAPARPYDLMVGDAAPKLAIDTWVKGEPIAAFMPGSVYVVEFWATWCGPCIGGMPHLSELQEKYAEQKVRIVGVNIWDDPANVTPFMENDVKMHGQPGDKIMRYTVAVEHKHNPDDVRNGRMAMDWMQASGRNGIPSAFIVDQQARVAWIGHPMGMDQALEQIVAGEWDLAQETRKYAAAIAAQAKIEKYDTLFRKADYEAAYKLGHELVDGPLADNPMGLNSVAWGIVDPDNVPEKRDLELALKAAERAVELTKEENPAILDTLAKVHYDLGQLTEAVKWQQLAVHQAKDNAEMGAELKERLREFERALAAKDAKAKKKDGGKGK